jgi:hypothetical protein
MAELQWDKTDWLVCLGVLPEVAEYETLFIYRVERAGMILILEVTPHESIIEIKLQRQGQEQDLLNLTFLVDGIVEYRQEKWGNYLQLWSCRMVTSRFYYIQERGDGDISPNALVNVEITVDPDIWIQCGR